MRFYRIEAKLDSEEKIPARHSEELDSFTDEMKSVSEKFYENTGRKNYVCAVRSEKNNGFRFAAIISDDSDCEAVFESYLKVCSVKCESYSAEEVTLKTLQAELNTADHTDYIEDSEDLLELFGILPFSGYRRTTTYDENIIKLKTRKQIEEKAYNSLYSESFLPEIDRIYSGKKQKGAVGHPVHYLVRTREDDTRRDLCRLLISALYENGRIINRRYAYVDFDDRSNFSDSEYDAIYKSCSGGTIIVRYRGDDYDEDSGFARRSNEIIQNLCKTATRFRNSVLTIFWAQLDSVHVRDTFISNLDEVPIVEITEDFADEERAKKYLKNKAKEYSVRTDKRLFANIKPNGTYNIKELNRIFGDWYTHKLHTDIYSQYKDINTAKVEVIKEKPKGNAAKELEEMIGLESAKKVINDAVSFFKMQKVYNERGLSANRPSMHMVFTGNPGTAKTTVARLFARIMRDNGLLTKGDLFEVGRGDLVGKYVGWTAPTIQKYFKMAKGSVLFIDEAYSLVDDRDGCFGDEAINTIVQEMENNRDDLVVIFAGYPDKMEEFLNKNPGLRSRIAFHVSFDDYNTEELVDIADLMIKKTGFEFSEGAHDKLADIFSAAGLIPDFGNGRYVRNLIELSTLQQASRLAKTDIETLSDDDVRIITKEDICIPMAKHNDSARKSIGF